MKKIIVFKIILLSCMFSYSQEFKMKLWFQDAVGNKDSIELGYDLLATDSIDSQFGETNIISTPWSNNFEVRAGDAATSLNNLYITSPATLYTKKQFIHKTCNFFHLIKVAVNCNHFPIVVKWDTSLFSNDLCRYASFITSGTGWGGDWFDGVMAFMNPMHIGDYKDSLVIGSLSSPVHFQQNGKDIIQLNVSFGNSEPLGILDLQKKTETFKVFPNPSNGSFFVNANTAYKESINIQVFNVLGEKIYQKEFRNFYNQKIELNNIENGIYQILITRLNGKTFIKKIIINK